MHGPFEVTLKLRLTDGKRNAVVSCDLPIGVLPTKESIVKAMEEALAAARDQGGKKFRWQNRNEFENDVLSERYGGMTPHFATKETWDAW